MTKTNVNEKKRNYEVAFLVREGDVSKITVDRIKEYLTKANGTFTGESDMGIKQLAYEIHKNREKFTRAFYYFLKAEMFPSTIVEFEKHIKIDEDIIRHMVLLED